MAGVTAQAADGSIHEFADGTSPAVIDRVMKRYAQTKANPTAVSATPTGPINIADLWPQWLSLHQACSSLLHLL
jgi:hypothetical protein